MGSPASRSIDAAAKCQICAFRLSPGLCGSVAWGYQWALWLSRLGRPAGPMAQPAPWLSQFFLSEVRCAER